MFTLFDGTNFHIFPPVSYSNIIYFQLCSIKSKMYQTNIKFSKSSWIILCIYNIYKMSSQIVKHICLQ